MLKEIHDLEYDNNKLKKVLHESLFMFEQTKDKIEENVILSLNDVEKLEVIINKIKGVLNV